MGRSEGEALWRSAKGAGPGVFDAGALGGLPEPARRYLGHAIASGAAAPAAVRFGIEGEIKLGARWVPFRGAQVIAPADGFVFTGAARMGLLRVEGYDRLIDGCGEMAWRLFGVIPVARGAGVDVTRSAAGRFNGEAVFTPHRLLPAAGARWEAAGADAATVVVSGFGETTRVTIAVDAAGRARAVRFDRWGDFGGRGFRMQPFGVVCEGELAAGGLRVPGALRAGWGEPDALGEGEFFRARLSDLEVRMP